MAAELDTFVAVLRRTFDTERDKYAAHDRARTILQDMAAAPAMFTSILERHLARDDAFSQRHHPVISLSIDSNPHFELVANCWIPLPDGVTNLSTKAIHHHGDMILTTVTSFGPGYEHWCFTTPEAIDSSDGLYAMRLLERAPHPNGHAAFVDAHIGHVPFYPASLSITLALWSTCRPTTWKDALKRVPALHKHRTALRRVAAAAGLRRVLDLKIVRYFDYYPSPDGFRGIEERTEFERGPNEDYLYSLFHLVQQTGNAALGRKVRARADLSSQANGALVAELLDHLERGDSIDGRLSHGHYDLPHANFRAEDILEALAARARPVAPPAA